MTLHSPLNESDKVISKQNKSWLELVLCSSSSGRRGGRGGAMGRSITGRGGAKGSSHLPAASS